MPASVSVVIKSYNHADHIGIALESVLSQTFQDFEIIIIDDGSTDDSASVIERYGDPRISFEPWPNNRGLSTAMNALIEKASGEFVAIVNSDDFALAGRLEHQVGYLKSHPDVAAVFSQVRYVDEEGRSLPDLGLFSAPLSFPDFTQATWLRQFFFKGNCLCAPSAMVRREAYRRVGPYDPRLTNLQDLDIWVRMTACGELHVLGEILSGFRIRAKNANLSAPRVDTQIRSHFELYRILLRFPEMDGHVLLNAFQQDLQQRGIDADSGSRRWLGELALTIDKPAHRLFAVQSLFESARTDTDYRHLREVAGTTNVFGISASPMASLIPSWADPVDHPEVDFIHLLADDEPILPQLDGECAMFQFSSRARRVLLLSPSFVTPVDDRRLGLSITAVEISDSCGSRRSVDLASSQLGNGFHGVEGEANQRWRWTNGSADLHPSLWADCSGDVILTLRGYFSGFQNQQGNQNRLTV